MNKENYSSHYKNKRYKRETFIDKYLNGGGIVVDSFIVDRKHPMGLERHDITENGVIIIYNVVSKKMVTKLIARPHQIMRYYEKSGRTPPSEYQSVLELARMHNILGYNDM